MKNLLAFSQLGRSATMYNSLNCYLFNLNLANNNDVVLKRSILL